MDPMAVRVAELMGTPRAHSIMPRSPSGSKQRPEIRLQSDLTTTLSQFYEHPCGRSPDMGPGRPWAGGGGSRPRNRLRLAKTP